MKYTCFGAAREVTGSCHMLEAGGRRILLDCGLIQGTPQEEERNWKPFPFDVHSIDAVVLSHAHIDHSGRLPLLRRAGYAGPIFTHPATRDLCRVMLRDAAYINEKDAEWENRKRSRKSGRNNKKSGDPAQPLYDRADAEAVMTQFVDVPYDTRRQILPGIEIRLQDAGHILGAAIVEVWLQDEDRHCKLVYTGDLGHGGRPILRDPATVNEADVVLLESTYGDRLHRGWDETYDELKQIFSHTSSAQGNILVPAFAVGRTQALLYLIARNRQQWGLDRWQVFLDSPMAIEATEIHLRYSDLYRPEAAEFWRPGSHHDVLDQLTYTRTPAESMRLNDITSGAVIIAGSGMCTGGRIRHHLRHNVWREDCHIIIVGYQERGTLGRALVDGARNISLWGQTYPVEATIHTVGGLSAHADRDELMQWIGAFPKSVPAWLVHGEEEAQLSLQAVLQQDQGRAVEIVKFARPMPLPVRRQPGSAKVAGA